MVDSTSKKKTPASAHQPNRLFQTARDAATRNQVSYERYISDKENEVSDENKQILYLKNIYILNVLARNVSLPEWGEAR